MASGGVRWYPQKLLVRRRYLQTRYQHAPNRYGNPRGEARRPNRLALRWWRAAIVDYAGPQVHAVGVCPATGLREAGEGAKRLLGEEKGPAIAKKFAKAARASESANTFDAVAAELLDKKRREGKAFRTMGKVEWLSSLASPANGPRPIAEITAPEGLAVLRGVEIARPSARFSGSPWPPAAPTPTLPGRSRAL